MNSVIISVRTVVCGDNEVKYFKCYDRKTKIYLSLYEQRPWLMAMQGLAWDPWAPFMTVATWNPRGKWFILKCSPRKLDRSVSVNSPALILQESSGFCLGKKSALKIRLNMAKAG